MDATERAPLMGQFPGPGPGPLTDGQFYSPPESLAGPSVTLRSPKQI